MIFHPESEYSILESQVLLLRPGEAASVLHVSIQTLRNWARQGKIRCVRTPTGQLRYPKDAVRALLDGRPKDAEPVTGPAQPSGPADS